MSNGQPPLAAPSSTLEEDLSATLGALDLQHQQSLDPPSLPAPIPLVRSTSDSRQPKPSALSHDNSPSPERATSASYSSPSSSSPFPKTPTEAILVHPIVSPPPPSRRTCVILQEACTKHRYTRNSDIGTIVERPERVRAVKTGVAAAWARLESRNVAHGGTRWAGPPEPSLKDEEDQLEVMMRGMGLADKGKGKEVLGGPFDIIYSTAVLPVDDPALLYVHPLPNVPPTPSASAPPPPPPSPPILPSSRQPRTPSATPSKPTTTSTAPSSAPPKLPSSPPALDPSLPWPHQLSALCKNATTAMLSPPYSEIPPHLPQGDLYLTDGSEEAIFGALGAVCEGVDRIVEGSRTGGIGYDRAFVAIRPPGHVSRASLLGGGTS